MVYTVNDESKDQLLFCSNPISSQSEQSVEPNNQLTFSWSLGGTQHQLIQKICWSSFVQTETPIWTTSGGMIIFCWTQRISVSVMSRSAFSRTKHCQLKNSANLLVKINDLADRWDQLMFFFQDQMIILSKWLADLLVESDVQVSQAISRSEHSINHLLIQINIQLIKMISRPVIVCSEWSLSPVV